MRKFICSVVAVFAVCGVALTDEFTGIITKVEDGKVTFTKFDFQNQEKADPKTLPTTKDVKVVKGNFNKDDFKIEAGDKIEKGLKDEVFAKIDTESKFGGVFAHIVTDKDNKNITEIRVMAFGKGKKKDK